MNDTHEGDPNSWYGIIPNDIYQNLKSPEFSVRLEAAQILSKSLPSSFSSDTSTELGSFFEFCKNFLIDENFGVINCFDEILNFVFSNVDKDLLQKHLNEVINMLIPPLQDKRNAVRSISSQLVIKYSTILKTTKLLDHLISIFYDQPINTQVEMINLTSKFLTIPDIYYDNEEFGKRINNLIESAFLIVNMNVHSAAVRLLRQIHQLKPDIYNSIPEEYKKFEEDESKAKVSTCRLPKTPTSALPPIYIRQKTAQGEMHSPKPPDTATSKKRSDEFWYKSKPRFAKTAGFIIGKGGFIKLTSSASQQYSSTAHVPHVSSNNSFPQTPEGVFQRSDGEPSDECGGVHVYDQIVNDDMEIEAINGHSIQSRDADDDDQSREFEQFDSMPAPRVATSSETVDFESKPLCDKLGLCASKIFLGADESRSSEDEADDTAASHESLVPSSRQVRQFKPRPPSLPPTAPPSIFASRDGSDNDDDSHQDASTPSYAAKLKKLTRSGGASFRAKRPTAKTAKTAQTAKTVPKAPKTAKPDLPSIVSDLQAASDWERQSAALQQVQSMVSSAPSFVSANIRALCLEIVPLCSSIRSALSKTALECLTSVAAAFGPEMNPFFEGIVNSLLTILLSSKGFIARLASGCIATILRSVSRKKALEYLTGDHRKRPGSCKATLAMCLEELVGEMNSGDENDIEVVSVEVMKALGSFITDANPETRKFARSAVKKMAANYPNLASAVSCMQFDESEKKVILDAIAK